MKKTISILLAVFLLLSLAACAADEMKSAVEMETGAPAYERAQSVEGAFRNEYAVSDENMNAYDSVGERELGTPASGSDMQTAVENGRKLIRRISLSVETDDYPVFVESFQSKLLALGGYIEDMEASTSGRCPCATILVRVPADRLNELTDSVSGIGNITYKHESQQDVTLQYTDTESHITALRTEQDRLLQLLNKAENLSEILEIEDRMTSVRYQLESYERSLRALSNQVEYATATIEVVQVERFTPTEELGYWEKIGKGLKDSVNGMWEDVKELFSDIVVSLPYLLLFAILPLVILLLVIKRIVRKRKAGKAQKSNTQPAQGSQEASVSSQDAGQR